MQKPKCLSQSNRLHVFFSLFALLAVLGFAPPAHAKTHLKISANTQIIESFKNWTASTPWETIEKYDNPNAYRPTGDLVLELQALKAGGLDFDFEFVTVPNYERGRIEVSEGRADLSAETIWEREITPALLRTEPVIRDGEFEKGLYALPEIAGSLKASTLEELQQLSIVMVATWDVEMVEKIHPKVYEKAAKIENVAQMLQKKRGDYTLLEFSSSPDLSVDIAGVKLAPVANCKVALPGSRSWIVCKASPQSAEIAAALDKGLKAMRAEGRIERAFKESGFFNQKVSGWKRLL